MSKIALSPKARQVIEAFEATGRIVSIRKSRKTGKITASISGQSGIPLHLALERMQDILKTRV